MKKITHIRVFFLFISILHFSVLAANGQSAGLQHFVDSGKIPPGILQKLEVSDEVEILVHLEESDIKNIAQNKMNERGLKYQDKAIVKDKARRYADRKKLIFSRLASVDYLVENDYEYLPVVHMTVNSQSLSRLLQMDEVYSVGENLALFPHLTESLDLIGAPATHIDGFTGSGTAVAVLDTGVDYTHAAFGGCTTPNIPETCKVAYVQDFAPNDSELDSSGHGTNVSGIVVGVAPDTKIIGLDVFNGASASYTDILSALNWVLNNHDTYNIVAVNMSLGNSDLNDSPCSGDGLASSIIALKDAGVSTVISSGNDGFTTGITNPACVPDALSVGAVYDAYVGGTINYSACSDSFPSADKVACFSNSADFLSLLAPGALITSAGTTKAGTSQAAPHVAGAVAVLKELDGLFSVDDILNQLTGTGVPVTDYRNDITTPRLDLYTAVTDLQPPSSNFSALPLSGNAPLIVDFSDLTAWFPNAWDWDFGDTEISSQQNPTHLYEMPGTYSITLTAGNTFGSDLFSRDFYIDVFSCPNLPAMINPSEFSSLQIQTAYNNAIDGDTIKSHAVSFTEDLLFNRDIAITLAGGFNCEYSNSVPATKLIGSLIISYGTVTVDKLVIQ